MRRPGTAHLGDRLSALADGELAGPEAADAAAHLAACPACTAELAGVHLARSAVRSLPRLDPPAPLVARPRTVPVARRPRPTPAPARRWPVPVAAAAAAAAFAVLLGVGGTVAGDPAPVGRLVQVHATSAVNADPVSQLAPSIIPVSFTSAAAGP